MGNKEQCQVISDVNYCKQMDGDADNGCKLIQPDDQKRCGWCPSTNKTIPMQIVGKLKQPKYTAANKYYPQDRNCNYDWKGFGYEKGPLLVDEECGKVNQCMGEFSTKNAIIVKENSKDKYKVKLEKSNEEIEEVDIKQIKTRDNKTKNKYNPNEKVKISMYGLDANNNDACKRWVWNNVGCNYDAYPGNQNNLLFPEMAGPSE